MSEMQARPPQAAPQQERGGRLRHGERHRRLLVLAWLALIVLMLSSLGAAYLPLSGGTKLAIGLAIALVKASIVALAFMELARGHVLVRVVVAVAVGALALLMGVGSVDFGARHNEPAAMQVPQQPATSRPERR